MTKQITRENAVKIMKMIRSYDARDSDMMFDSPFYRINEAGREAVRQQLEQSYKHFQNSHDMEKNRCLDVWLDEAITHLAENGADMFDPEGLFVTVGEIPARDHVKGHSEAIMLDESHFDYFISAVEGEPLETTKELHDELNDVLRRIHGEDVTELQVDFAWWELSKNAVNKIKTMLRNESYVKKIVYPETVLQERAEKIAQKLQVRILSGEPKSIFEEYDLNFDDDVAYFVWGARNI